MSYFDDASLVMIPSGYKTSKVYSVKPTDGSGDLTFSRSNDTATRVNSAGLIEKVRSNFALRSQSFATSATWSTVSGTITNNAGTAPDGTNTASKIVAGNSDPYVYQPLTLSGSVAVSCYVKGIGSSIGKVARILVGASMTDVTMDGTWQRISVAHTASGAELYGLEIPNPAAVGDEVLMWGFQVEYGDIATAYIATTTAAVSVGPVANVPRLDYLNSSCPRLLLEPQRTNLLQYSEQFNNAWWAASNSTISANAVTSPDGYTNADNLVENTANSTHGVGNLSGLTLTAAAYTFSVFVKKQNRNFFAISTYDGSSTLEGYFNINTGAVATMPAGLTGAITSYGNGWYRCSVTRTMGANANNYFAFNAAATDGGSTYTGTGVVACSIYGGSLELGAYATSYIPTLGASVTRGADACSKTGISSLIGQTEGTIFVDLNFDNSSSSFQVGFAISDNAGPTNKHVWLGRNNYNFLTAFLRNTSYYIQYSPSSGGITSNGRHKMAIAYASNNAALYIDGVQIATSSSVVVPTMNQAEFGLFAASIDQADSKINQALLFKTRLTNAQLAELTTI